MARKWTPEQQNAIDSTGGTVLVAAAAGSGKTSVLVQRVINRITDEKNPISLDKFLIVTFTTAAAKEMKDRISDSLSNLITKNPENLNLRRQQMLLKSSSIGTIDSFCNNIVKENFYMLGISPNFKIATDSELLLISEKAMENTFEYFYENRNEDFIRLLDAFGGEKDNEKLEIIIKSISKFMDSLAFPEIWFEKILRLYEEGIKSDKPNVWSEVILDYSRSAIDYAVFLMKDAAKVAGNFEDLKKSYSECLESEITSLEEIREVLKSGSWDEVSSKVNSFSFSRLKPCRTKENEIYKNEVVSKRNYAKSVFVSVKKHFTSDFQGIRQSLEYIYPLVKTLSEVTLRFREEVWAMKLLKNMLDFSDLERLTLKILTQNPEPLTKSSVAKEISERYEEVMVDEYQDINEMQDTIFKLITKGESNLFMVGDVKQSIYKFRQSRPKIFLAKKDKYPLYNENEQMYPSKIILGKNFRSKSSIIDGVNMIFRCLMSKDVGEISYTGEEELSCGAEYENSQEKDISLKLIEMNSDDDESILEAREIAKTIMKLISEGYKVKKGDEYRNATYSDFCVLLRKSSSFAHIYAKELNACGVPSWTETNDKFLATPEISTMLSILKVVDNIVDDVPLISAMVSPLFNFTVDELSTIRLAERDAPFYFALKKCENSSEKVRSFLDKIDYYRSISGTMPCSELIDLIYQTTDYPSICLALPAGEVKKANLLLLKEYAKKFDDESSKGLSGFLGFIRNLEKKNSDLPSASLSSEAENTVKIMSIHKSKGLEFPVCIIAGCSKKFTKDNDSILIHPDLGLGIKSKSSDGLVKHSNLIHKAVNIKNTAEGISEEVRVLYVALTRAKQKIILVASVKDREKIAEKCLLIQSFDRPYPYLVQNSENFLEWFLICICFSNMKKRLFEVLGIENQFVNNEENFGNLDLKIELLEPINLEDSLEETALTTNVEEEIDKEFLEKITSYSNFKYPYKNSSELPIKIAASRLSHSGEWQKYFASSVPQFMSYSKISATAKGNAMHRFMCLADFKRASEDFDLELTRLSSSNLLTAEEMKLLNSNLIKNFLDSELCKRILKSPKVLREHRFSVKMPLSISKEQKDNFKADSEENSVVVQGAMDCIFIEDGKFVIVDYKTDKAESAKSLYDKYISQLEIYKLALEEIEDIKVKETGIYSFYLSDYYSESASSTA